MMNGKKLVMTTGDVATINSSGLEQVNYHRIRLETSAGFDRTVTIKRRVRQELGGQAFTGVAAWYRKESDGTIASAAIVPGASAIAEYTVDSVGSTVTVEVSGGTAGTVSVFWSSVNA